MSDFFAYEGFLSPSLIYPTNGQADVPYPVTLVWGEHTGALGYDVQVATDQAFSNVVVNARTDQTTYNLDGLINYDQGYYWRVRPVV